MNKIETIIFDLGGVLIDWNPKALFVKIFKGDAEKANWFIENVCTQEWNTKQDAGKPFSEAINEKIKEFPNYEKHINAYFERWDEMITGEIPGTVKILKDIHNSNEYKLLSLTNWSTETFPFALKRFSFLELFDDIIVSGKIKMIKPEKQIFEYVIKKHCINPEKTLFIDNNIENVKASKELNFKGIHFRNPQQLKTELRKYKIEV